MNELKILIHEEKYVRKIVFQHANSQLLWSKKMEIIDQYENFPKNVTHSVINGFDVILIEIHKK